MATRKIGVTGGSGFIGRHLIETLSASENDYEVVILDLKEPPYSGDYEYIQGDVRDEEVVAKFCNGLDAVVHLAAAHHDFGVSREEFFSVNEKGMQVLCDAMANAGVNHLVFYSTVAVYDYRDKGPIDESKTPNPLNDYGQSKLAAEKVVENWMNDQRSAQIIRPTVVIGPRNIANMYSLIDQINRGRYIFHFGGGQNIKSLAVVMNLVGFTEYLISREQPEQRAGVFNFVDYPQLKVNETVSVVHEELERRNPRLRVPLWLALLGGKFFDILIAVTGKNLPISSARIKKLATSTKFEGKRVEAAGYQRPYTAEQGLREMVRWYREHKGLVKSRTTPASSSEAATGTSKSG
ncbi:MAG: NAD(P)-dependent oxidoreductase [Planctomycetota bacterium]